MNRHARTTHIDYMSEILLRIKIKTHEKYLDQDDILPYFAG